MVVKSSGVQQRVTNLLSLPQRNLARKKEDRLSPGSVPVATDQLDALMQPDIDANLEEVINLTPIPSDEISSDGDLRLSDPRYLDEAHSLTELRDDPIYPAKFEPNWLREKVVVDIKGFDVAVLLEALDDLHNDFAVIKRFRNCPYVNKRPSLQEHLDNSIDLAWRFMQEAGIKPESRFGEIVAWMIKVHDAGEGLGEFVTDSEARSGYHDRDARVALEKRVARNLLLFKIDSVLRQDSSQYQSFLDEGRRAFALKNAKSSMLNVAEFLDALTEERRSIDPRAAIATERLMRFSDAFEEGEGFAAAFSRVVEKLETVAFVIRNHILDKFDLGDIASVKKYVSDPINHMRKLARGLDNDLVTRLVAVVNKYDRGQVRQLEFLRQSKKRISSD